MLLGDRTFKRKVFLGLDSIFELFLSPQFRDLPDRKKSDQINRTLLELIQKEPVPCFLLPHVLDFVEKIDRKGILHHYTFTSFELWLNQSSELSHSANLEIRAKIAGKKIERSDYQVFFPIGMGKTYEGTHFVTAHRSPDLDTTIASFWGWLDAFAARVGDSLHIWNLPEGPPPSQIEIEWIFRDLFGPAIFTHLPKLKTALHLTGNDLMTQRGMVKKKIEDSIAGMEHDREKPAIVVVDEQGFYIGDWRSLDAEGVQQVIILLSSCMRWFENHLHLQLIAMFAKQDLSMREIEPELRALFSMRIEDCEPASEFHAKQRKEIDDFLREVLRVEKGLKASFEEMGAVLAALSEVTFKGVDRLIEAVQALFDRTGKLREERPQIFSFLERAVKQLHEGILKIRSRLERLDIALETKQKVFGRHPTFVTVRSDLEEIRQKMGSHTYLTVVYPDRDRLVPVGIIQAKDLNKAVLGTVSLRDFCNREEMAIPEYLDVISVIDHHKTKLDTASPPFAIIADAQSTNTLVAGQAFEINDRYSFGGQTLQSIEAQIKEENGALQSPQSIRRMQRLFKKKIASQKKDHFFIDPDREYIEYLHFLYGILDDTDLLTKVTPIDVERVASLLCRMKSLVLQKEVEVVSFEDLPKDREFARKAAKRLLQNEDLYSLYKKAYEYREQEVEKNIALASQEKPSFFFSDTKEQNGCCRIGQTKRFASNVKAFQKLGPSLQKMWVKQAIEIWQKRPEIDLHLYMISTIPSAQDVYEGKEGHYEHQDELWIWVPEKEIAFDHLRFFLSAFQRSPGWTKEGIVGEIAGKQAEVWKMIFRESLLDVPLKIIPGEFPIAILKYKAGTVNSRKAMVSPFLPRLN